jgi:hypothetical protein
MGIFPKKICLIFALIFQFKPLFFEKTQFENGRSLCFPLYLLIREHKSGRFVEEKLNFQIEFSQKQA